MSLDYARDMVWVIKDDKSDSYLLGDVSKSLYIASVFNNTAVTFLGPDKKAESAINTAVIGNHTAIFLLADNPGKTVTGTVTVWESMPGADESTENVENPAESGTELEESNPDSGNTNTGDPDAGDPSDSGSDNSEPEGVTPTGDADNQRPESEQSQTISAPYPKFGQITLPQGQLTVPMRPEASHSKPPVISLKEGMIVAVVGQTGSWYMAQYGDYAGFISSGSLVTPAKTTFTGKVTAPQQSGATELPFYSSADLDGEPLRMLGVGQTISVTGVIDGWYEVTAGSDTGYMQISHLVLS